MKYYKNSTTEETKKGIFWVQITSDEYMKLRKENPIKVCKSRK